MAGDELIDDYLASLRRKLAWTPDVDDVIAEAEDHLRCAMERLVDDGVSPDDARREVLGRFGHPTTVAAAHAATSRGGVAMPTKFTKIAGVAALVSAALWAMTGLAWLMSEFAAPSDRADTALALLAFATLIGGAATTALLVVGLYLRHGGLGPLGIIGMGLIGLGVVATLLFWFVMGWGVLLALGMLLVAVAVRARGLAPTGATLAFGAAWLVGVTTWSVLRVMEVGTRDEWGDYPVVSPIAIAIGVTILVPGLIGLGRWLSGETPQDLDVPSPLATS